MPLFGLIQVRTDGTGGAGITMNASAIGTRYVRAQATTDLVLNGLAQSSSINKIQAQTNMTFGEQAVARLLARVSGNVDFTFHSNPMISAMVPGGIIETGTKLNIYEYRIIVQKIPENSNMKEYDQVIDQINLLAKERWRIDKFMTGPQRLIFILIRERL